MQLIQLPTGLLVTKLYGTFMLAFALNLDFIKCLVKADNICSHFESQSFYAENCNDYQKHGNDTYNDCDLDENFSLQLDRTLTNPLIELSPILHKGQIE